jgi:hypothetical protein
MLDTTLLYTTIKSTFIQIEDPEEGWFKDNNPRCVEIKGLV